MTRIRLFIVLARPAVVVLLGLFAATGLAEGGAGNDPVALFKALIVVIGFLLFSVALNDVADEAIDRINLPNDPSRPLVAGGGSRREFIVVAASAAVVAVSMSMFIASRAALVVIAGLALSASYSLRPIRIADRGAVASLILPAGYVAVPYLVGIFSARSTVTPRDFALLGGLYIGFIGRILLKDFRDVRGDALFGKRTFLVRYGRRTTCISSGVCWIAGAATLVAVRSVTVTLVGGYVACVGIALALLRELAADRGARHDEFVISAIAIIGRGMIVVLIAHLAMRDAHWSVLASSAAIAALVVVTAGQAHNMFRHGPRSRLTLPEGWAAVRAADPA